MEPGSIILVDATFFGLFITADSKKSCLPLVYATLSRQKVHGIINSASATEVFLKSLDLRGCRMRAVPLNSCGLRVSGKLWVLK